MESRKPANRGQKYPAEVLEPGEVQALIAACSNRAPTGIRNRALIALLYGAGLRCAEALALKPKDVNTSTGVVRVLRGKGSKPRTVALDTASCSLVDRWLDRRAKLGHNGHRALLCTLQGGQVSTAYVRALMPRLGRKAGLEKRVHAHGLRHSRAAQLRRQGVDLVVIQTMLGHSSLQTTQVYLRDIQPTEVIDAMRGDPWA